MYFFFLFNISHLLYFPPSFRALASGNGKSFLIISGSGNSSHLNVEETKSLLIL